MKLNGLEQYFNTNNNGLIEDFKQFNKRGFSPLVFSVYYNLEKNLNLSVEQWDYLIKNSDLKKVIIGGWSSLMFVFRHNKDQDLNLNNEQLDYMIKNSDLKQITQYHDSALIFALEYNKSQNLNLNKEQWKYLIENSDLSFIKDKEQLIELKKIQSELLNNEILDKIEIKEKIKKVNKI